MATRVLITMLVVVAALLPVPMVAAADPTIVTFEDLSHANTGRSSTAVKSRGGAELPGCRS